MSTRQYVHTSDKLPNTGDFVELKSTVTGKPFKAVFSGVSCGLPKWHEVLSTGIANESFTRACVWRHFSERYAAVCALAEQGWWDSREAKPSLHQDIFVSDGVTVDPVRYEGDPSKGYLGLMGSCRLRFAENFFYWKPRTPEVTPPPPNVPKPAPIRPALSPSSPQPSWPPYEANKAVWVHGSITLPKHRQHVWVSIDSTVELCQYLSTDLQFEVLSGPDRCRRFARNLWWQAVLPPTERFDKLDNS